MAIFKRDVNLGLLLLIVAALLMFSGFTVYYQTTFKNLSVTYQNQLNELDKVTKDLDAKRGMLNQTSTQLQLKSQQEQDLSKKFVDTKTERDQLESDKKSLQVELASTKSTLASTVSKLNDVQTQLANTLIELQKKTVDLSNALADVAKFKPYKDKYECAKSKPDAEEGSC
ncbi:hypothetical protein HYS31_08020 [Candidatus Woesearchaeota archaeon]|nr:hypothetical protein [Candidatus Woesearchaeota archaeon]